MSGNKVVFKGFVVDGQSSPIIVDLLVNFQDMAFSLKTSDHWPTSSQLLLVQSDPPVNLVFKSCQ